MGNIVKPKILVMSIGTGLGGIEKSMVEFLRFLASDGNFDVDLYLWRSPGILYSQIPPTINILKYDVSPLGLKECKKTRDFIKYFCFRALDFCYLGTKVLERIDTQYNLAIAYCQVGFTPHYVIDKVRADKKYLFYHHGSYDTNFLEHLIDKIYYRSYDGIITMSKASATMMKKSFPECMTKIYSCSPLFDPDTIRELSKTGKSFVDKYADSIPTLVTVARLSEEKGILKALKAANILKNKGLKFRWLFIGGGSDEIAYKNYISTNNLGSYCILTGRKENPYPYMSIATLYIQPSNVESYGITIREAAIFNVPIIVSNIPAFCEASLEINNLQFTSNEPQELANKIFGILTDIEGLERGDYRASFKTKPNELSIKILQEIFINKDKQKECLNKELEA